jgi:hypothetical protein
MARNPTVFEHPRRENLPTRRNANRAVNHYRPHPHVFSDLWQVKGAFLDLRIQKELEARFLDLRILKDLGIV